MYCSKCGKMIKDGAAFCVYCGNRVEDIGKTESEGVIKNTYTLKNQHFKYFAAVAAVAVILILILALILPELRDRSGLKKGDIITFGEYEQDGDTSNGPEPIEWEVLDNGSDGMLVISRYILDAKPYNEYKEGDTGVTWETCTLRKWLNDEFYNESFSPDERSGIKETLVVNDNNKYYGTEGGNDTRDKVFLLSEDEVLRYYDFNEYDKKDCNGWCEKLITEGTKYARDNGLDTSTITIDQDYFVDNLKELGYSGECVGLAGGWWWLRSPSANSWGACDVSAAGGAGKDFCYNIGYGHIGVRPALYLEKYETAAVSESSKEEVVVQETAVTNESIFEESTEQSEEAEKGNEEKPNPASSRFSFDNGYKKGDIITFGEYEQDGDTSNGPEPIEWEVLDNGSDGMLVISRYILDAKPYNEEFTGVTWETCTLRKWLNDEFYNDAFSPDERSMIKETLVKHDDNESWGIEGGNDTRDKVFLLSVDEVLRYYDFNVYDEEKCNGLCEKLISEGTKYALDNGLFTHTISQDDYDQGLKEIGYSGDLKEIGYSGECVGLAGGWWWLRTPGFNSVNVCYVDYYGYAGASDCFSGVDGSRVGVRPALKLE